jgi:predicted O-methyltransferase YrrM
LLLLNTCAWTEGGVPVPTSVTARPAFARHRQYNRPFLHTIAGSRPGVYDILRQYNAALCGMKAAGIYMRFKPFTFTKEIHDTIKAYIHNLITPDNPILPRILDDEAESSDALPSIGPDVGKLSGLLIRLISAKKVLEFGTCLGYSTVWLAEAVKATGGRLVSVEYDKKFFDITTKNLARAGLSRYVQLIRGDANEIIDTLEGPFDVIFQDSDKDLYPIMLEKCIGLVRKNGLLITDDTLFKPMGLPEHLCASIEKFNHLVFGDPRLYSTILPIGDGLVVSVKV